MKTTIVGLICFAAVGLFSVASTAQNATNQPTQVVTRLYREVVARQPIGIPKGADMKVITPYLSKALLHKIDSARACEDDYYRRHHNPNEKPEIEWLEFGLFTGGNERVSPRAFHVERTQSERDGSSRVHVRLTYGPEPNPWVWHVAAIVIQERVRTVVDDIVFLKDDETDEAEFRLSETLVSGCDGSRWVGYKAQTGR